MSKTPLFSRRVPFFGNVAVLALCIVFFLVPFGFRGARLALRDMRNEVSDWLPRDFPETKELDWFRENFLGSQFVVISWDGCDESDERYKAMLAKLRSDSTSIPLQGNDRKAKELADQFGLHVTEDLYEDWGENGEKWLIGDGDQWYYVTSDGGLYRWSGSQNVVGLVTRSITRLVSGRNTVSGELIHQFDPEYGAQVYRFPGKLNSRLFEQVLTGPEVFDRLAGAEGTLIRGSYDPRDPDTLAAQIEAHKRLTGVFFGPTPARGFPWTSKAFLDSLPEATRAELPSAWREFFDEFVSDLVEQRYGGDRQALIDATDGERLEHWYRLFFYLQVQPPPRQTCLLAVLSDVGTRDLSRVVGRPDFFDPVGRVYLAGEESGIAPVDLHLGGPPVDNVAIDEEGTITLVKLVSLSTLIGVSLAFISFRSVYVTGMIFFIGGAAAVISMGFVWFGGSSMDAILLSMPSLVYVLGLSGEVHIVNYYREACHERGPVGAAETALRHGWFPCTLAAFTTALGLVSLCTSNVIPIQKFGLFAAFGTMATVALLFTYLPSALTIWPPGYKREPKKDVSEMTAIHRFWDAIGAWIVKRYAWVCLACVLVMAACAVGLPQLRTSVQLLKMFDEDAKVIADYQWLEEHLGRLVPMELVLSVDPALQSADPLTSAGGAEAGAVPADVKLTFLERMELSSRVRSVVEREFGERGIGVIGPGMSSDVMVLPGEVPKFDEGLERTRAAYDRALLDNRELLSDELDFFRIDPDLGTEMWRISLRLGAFNDIDYGRFVADLKQAVEPVMAAYRFRTRILMEFARAQGEGKVVPEEASILIVGWSDYHAEPIERTEQGVDLSQASARIDQTGIFCESLRDLLENRGFRFEGRRRARAAYVMDLDDPRHRELLEADPAFHERLARFSLVVVVRPTGDKIDGVLKGAGVPIVDATAHRMEVDPATKLALSETAARRHVASPDAPEEMITSTYTGIVPIVYKTQRTLLTSLTDSIQLAFAMIAVVMMVLLRDWRRPFGVFNSLNFVGGLVSMLPNLFPVVIIFGLMGLQGLKVDIGSMMTASVALGVAVDDTIHFLSWFRLGMRHGLNRQEAIRSAYAKVAAAMTQTTLIGGLGLAAFAFSTFTPTQRFGIMMLTLLFAALVGDLVFLPALLASPLGRFVSVLPFRDPHDEEPVAEGPAGAAADMASAKTAPVAESSEGGAGPRGPGGGGRVHEGPHERVRDSASIPVGRDDGSRS